MARYIERWEQVDERLIQAKVYLHIQIHVGTKNKKGRGKVYHLLQNTKLLIQDIRVHRGYECGTASYLMKATV